MFNFFSKREKVTDLSWMGVDMHSHILPGLDDGSPDVATSIGFVKVFENMGLERLIGTPHIYKDLYPNTLETITAAKLLLQNEMDKEKCAIKLGVAAEYMLDQEFNPMENLAVFQNNYLLVEMSYLNESPNISETLFNLQIMGYKPILAHPERYTFYFKDMNRIKRFKEKGCLLQLNILSILGYYGKDVKQLAESLLKENLYDLVGTDLHHDKHLRELTKAVQSGQLHDLIGFYPFKNKELF